MSLVRFTIELPLFGHRGFKPASFHEWKKNGMQDPPRFNSEFRFGSHLTPHRFCLGVAAWLLPVARGAGDAIFLISQPATAHGAGRQIHAVLIKTWILEQNTVISRKEGALARSIWAAFI